MTFVMTGEPDEVSVTNDSYNSPEDFMIRTVFGNAALKSLSLAEVALASSEPVVIL